MEDKVPDFGTKKVGYVGAKYAPFNCAHCSHFISSISGCTHPEVLADKEVPQENSKMRYAKVEAQGCCNEFYPVKEVK